MLPRQGLQRHGSTSGSGAANEASRARVSTEARNADQVHGIVAWLTYADSPKWKFRTAKVERRNENERR